MSQQTIAQFTTPYLKTNNPDVRSGDVVRVHQKVKERGKERIQVFEGLIIATKHGKGISGTFTVRKIVKGIAVERTYPLHSPIIAKIEILRRGKVRRAKLYYMRHATGKRTRLKFQKYIAPEITEEQKDQETEEHPTETEEQQEQTEEPKTQS